MDLIGTYYPYFLIAALAWAIYVITQRRAHQRGMAIRLAAEEAGLTEPVSLHPVIDPAVCLGCGTCARVCPEGDILGIINGKAELVEPTHCIGHGACKAACPTGAISLVFGTAKRGVDLPMVGPDFQTNVPGIYIAGELGGMGLIRNAFTQGIEAMDAIAASGGTQRPDHYDVAIIGAGPAGFAAALRAKELNLRYVVLEQDDLGGAVFRYPRSKVVMTAPAKLPLVGELNFRRISKEELLKLWKQIERQHSLNISYQERVERITGALNGFVIETADKRFPCRNVLLAIGRRGTPRRLGVPGEQLEKVVYHLIDPEQYKGQHVMVVGGGDSALEAASSLATQPGTTVTLSYRGEAFGRARSVNRSNVAQYQNEGRLNLMLGTEVKEIFADRIVVAKQGIRSTLRNEAVIVCAGGVLPSDFLASCGIQMETKFGVR